MVHKMVYCCYLIELSSQILTRANNFSYTHSLSNTFNLYLLVVAHRTEDFGLPHIVIWVVGALKLLISKETPYRSTLRDPRGKAEPTIGGTRLTQWDSYSVRNKENIPEGKNRDDLK
ncbi:hypothetical protein H8356DRAFT_1363681 [Neocallimastix lanati (nom. inval.)]|nr:hypothetical protein H8356DRAFT_1363681 [Neocallimastix sp. JGI-2020a]